MKTVPRGKGTSGAKTASGREISNSRDDRRGRDVKPQSPDSTGISRPLPAPSPSKPATLWLPAALTVIFAGFTLLPRIGASPILKESFLALAGLLLAGLCALRWIVSRTGRTLTYAFIPRRVHWVQMIMHSSVYAYWGWYWREVYHEIPLILAQVAFLYVLDMLVCWFRRDNWILGFGPIPIILSTNLFLWFRDDWFFLQFAMIAVIVFGKEFVRWKRDGQSTHIFNPSAFALFLTSAILIATHTTPITWGPEISATFNNPPHIYLEIFVLGLIVEGLFSVTLVVLSGAAALYVLNLIYTGSTGMYAFFDFNIHPAVFLGLHLLVTDPATSPKRNFGKAVFGAAYGAGVLGLYLWLERIGAPTFYDKLLCVPVLNLTVRFLDRASIALDGWLGRRQWVIEGKLRPLRALAAGTPRQANFAFMGIWLVFFTFMMSTGFLARSQPRSAAVWEKACDAGQARGCRVLAKTLGADCHDDKAGGCFNLGKLLVGGKLPRDPNGAGRAFQRACELGLQSGCGSLVDLVKTDGDGVLLQSCDHGNRMSCFMLGLFYHAGQGVSRNLEYSATLFQRSCAAGLARGCGQLGESYLLGEGVPKDMVKARQILEKACDTGDGPGCFNVGIMHRDGIATPKESALAQARFRKGCDLGDQNSCKALETK